MAAFDHAASLGVDGLELDVRLSRDGIAVVHHDASLDRTTDVAGPLGARSADELAGLDAAYRFGPEDGFPMRGKGVGVPRLRTVLARHPELPVIIELKGDDPELVEAVLDDVRATGALDRVCLGSFSWRLLRLARRLEPRLASSAARDEVRLALYASWLGLSRTPVPYRAYQVPEFAGWIRVVSRRFVRLAHRARVTVQVWTVDEPGAMRRLLDWGVDALISDRPDVALRVRDEWHRPER